MNFTSPEQYGWDINNSVTQNTACIQAAINSGIPVWLQNQTYEVNSSLTFSSNTKLFGGGVNSKLYTQQNSPIISIVGDYCIVQNVTLQGNSTGTSQIGISVVGNVALSLSYTSNKITNCTFINLGGAGLYTQYMLGDEHEGAFQAVNCIAHGCNIGYYCDTRGEYNNFANCTASNCTVGFKNKGGNNNFVGGSLSSNTYGIYLDGGANDGHSVTTGTKINHNVNNVYVNTIANGYIFDACDFYAGDVVLISSDSIRFVGCDFSTLTNLTLTNSTNTKFSSNKFVDNPTNYNLTGSAPAWLDNEFLAGIPSYVKNSLVGKLNLSSLPTSAVGLSAGDVWNNSGILTIV